MNATATSLSTVVRTVIDLCRLRGGPQDAPHAPKLFVLLVGASIALDALTAQALGDSGNAVARSMLSTGLVLGLCWVALTLRNLRSRFVQTTTALIACSVAFSLLQWPLALLAGPIPASVGELSTGQMLFGWLTLLVFIWQLSVDAHIMRQAIDASFGLAFALVLSWVIACWAIDRIVFGV